MQTMMRKCLIIILFLIGTNGCSLLRPHFAPLTEPDKSIWQKTDFSQNLVPYAEFSQGGIAKDGIPPIDAPKFIKSAAATWLDPREPVIVVAVKGEARAYPLQILLYHEIVNDTIGGQAIAITYCPLCNTSIVFDRRINGRLLDFGTSGMLRKSDLVMYDRQTESWWQQFTGEALVGEFAGSSLNDMPSQLVTFAEFKQAYPDGQVLSRDTGYSKSYGKTYMMYYDRAGGRPYYYFNEVDTRLPPMERVLSISQNGQYRIYPLSLLKEQPIINDTFDGLAVVTFSHAGMLTVAHTRTISKARLISAATAFNRKIDGQTLTFGLKNGRIIDQQTQSQWNLLGQAVDGKLAGKQLQQVDNGVHYAFAWLGFRPNSDIFHRPKSQQ